MGIFVNYIASHFILSFAFRESIAVNELNLVLEIDLKKKDLEMTIKPNKFSAHKSSKQWDWVGSFMCHHAEFSSHALLSNVSYIIVACMKKRKLHNCCYLPK